jgi:hypothetical protein
MRKTILLILFTLLININVFPQYTNVTIFTPTLSSPPEEPSICINPKNINFLVAGANINYVSYSTNGGTNWATAYGLQSSSYGVWGDPCILCDTNGAFYYIHLANPPSPGNWIDRIVIQKSTNNGVSFSNPGSYTGLNGIKAQDKAWGIVDPRNNNIYITWTQFDEYDPTPYNPLDSSNILFSKSTDGGITWSTPKRIDKLGGDCVDSDNTVEGAVPCVGPNGEIYDAWAGPKIRNTQWGIFFNKSTDAGTTWLSQPNYVCDQPGGWDYMISGLQRANGMPITCCDISNGPYRGNIYIGYSDSAGSLDHDIKFVKSTNGGLNWSTPLRVNNDAAGKEQFLPWMTVDQKNGHIYFVFYDRRNYTNNATDVYIARSTDGGSTFSNILISSTPFTPTSGTFFGDYTNITAYNGRVRPIWARLQGTLSVLTAMIDFSSSVTNTTSNIPSEYKLEQNYPNPFNPTTQINYSVKENSYISLKVYNLVGQEIATLVNSIKQAGNYSINFDISEYNMPSGVYFYKLNADNYTETKKMIVTK